jgi:prepilin-type processing-associated H-X9-DG protein
LAQKTRCLNNLRQLNFAWGLYSDDNDGQLVESFPGTPTPNPYAWVLGDMQQATQVSSPTLVAKGKLYPYLNNTAVYRCSADPGVKIGGETYANTRSYSMNAFMGSRRRYGSPWNKTPGNNPAYPSFYERETELRSPSQLWVMIEEDERTIKDGDFSFDPEGRQYLKHLPAATAQRHNFGFGLSYADGHSEIWRFNAINLPANTLGSVESLEIPGNKDFERLGRVTAQAR